MSLIEFNDLLTKAGYEPSDVLVMRHRPTEREMRRVLPWFAEERPEVFNAYQQTQRERAEKALTNSRILASFIGLNSGEATWVGLYRVDGTTPISREEFAELPEFRELNRFGSITFQERDQREVIQKFNLTRLEFCRDWLGRLTIGWPGGERSWFRRAPRNTFPILQISKDSQFVSGVPNWRETTLAWHELAALPHAWAAALQEWRGVYIIRDTADGKIYVGSAGGEQNLLGRWLNYAQTGHGGNKQLRARTPTTFEFSILERVSPDMDADQLVALENSWKVRLGSREPAGLNAN